MGKRGPKAGASEAVIMDKIIAGWSDTKISKELKVSRPVVAKVRADYQNRTKTITNIDELKPLIRLEINQENTLSELANQMKDYTDQYNKAMSNNDEKAAYAWSQNRIKLVDMMAKITGLYNPRPIEQTPSENRQIIIYEMVD